jgi:hypothetical protein
MNTEMATAGFFLAAFGFLGSLLPRLRPLGHISSLLEQKWRPIVLLHRIPREAPIMERRANGGGCAKSIERRTSIPEGVVGRGSDQS